MKADFERIAAALGERGLTMEDVWLGTFEMPLAEFLASFETRERGEGGGLTYCGG